MLGCVSVANNLTTWGAWSCVTGLLVTGCISTPRFMREVEPWDPWPPDPDSSTVVFIRNGQPCETGGSYIVVSGQGQFLANLATGTRAEVRMAPGEHLIAAWNPRREQDVGLHAPQDVAVMAAHLLPGYVYYVHLAFTPDASIAYLAPAGELQPRALPFPDCRGVYRRMELVPIEPGSPRWGQIEDWNEETLAVAPESAAGQEYLDSDPDAVFEHLEIALHRLQRMSETELQQRTLSPELGVME